MIHVLVLSVKVRRNEQLKESVMAHFRHWQYVHANFWLQNFTVILIQGTKLPKKFAVLLISSSYTLKIALPFTSPSLAHNLLYDQLWMPLLYSLGISIDVGFLGENCHKSTLSWVKEDQLFHPLNMTHVSHTLAKGCFPLWPKVERSLISTNQIAKETKNSSSQPFTLEVKVQRPSQFRTPTYQYFPTKGMDSRRRFGSYMNGTQTILEM